MPPEYATFAGLAVLLVLMPGPDFAVVAKNGLAHGRAAGLLTGCGVVTSLLVQGGLAAFGIAALVARSAVAFTVLKFAGALYLGFLGVQALRAALAHRGRAGAGDEGYGPAAEPRRARWRGFRQGLLANLTNPKVLVFYFSLLPQFADPARPALPQVLVLAATHAAFSLLWFALVVLALDRLRTWLRRPRARLTLEGVTGVALLGFAVQLLTAAQR